MDESRVDALRDLLALLSGLIFVLAGGLGFLFFSFYKLAPMIVGPLDQPIENVLLLPFVGAIVVALLIGSFIGSTLWLIVMSRFLPKDTMRKWVTYGPQIQSLLRLNLRLLDALYADGKGAL